MKVLVISDIHGSGYYADKIREIVERENPEKTNFIRRLILPWSKKRFESRIQSNEGCRNIKLNERQAISSKRKL